VTKNETHNTFKPMMLRNEKQCSYRSTLREKSVTLFCI